MDLTRDVIYRGFYLNDSTIKERVTSGGVGSGLYGCMLETADTSDVDVIQSMEKRSQQDGMDAGDVFKGARRIRLSGTIYAVTRGLLFDIRRDLRAALDPVLAQMDEPLDKGFQPLYFTEPTNRQDYIGTGIIEFRVLCIPRAYQDMVSRDQMGGDDLDALALPWRATLICRDPSLMSAVPQDYDFTGTGVITTSIVNRGNYPVPLNLLFSIGTEAGTILFSANGTSNLITLPTSTYPRTVRYKGADKILTVEENGVESPKLDYMTFATIKTHAQIPYGTHDLTITCNGITLLDGSHAWIWETFS